MPGRGRVNIRAEVELIERLKRAAAIHKMSLTTFMLVVASSMADKTLAAAADLVDTE